MPPPGAPVEWTGRLRAEVPRYVAEQVREVTHQQRCSQVSLLLRALAALRDASGRRVFHIRAEDMVPDRRLLPRRWPSD